MAGVCASTGQIQLIEHGVSSPNSRAAMEGMVSRAGQKNGARKSPYALTSRHVAGPIYFANLAKEPSAWSLGCSRQYSTKSSDIWDSLPGWYSVAPFLPR